MAGHRVARESLDTAIRYFTSNSKSISSSIVTNTRNFLMHIADLIVNVEYYEEKIQTIRYKTISEIKPFESIYIPTFMLGDFKNKDIVQVRVDWC